MPPFCDGAPVSSALSVSIESPIFTVFESIVVVVPWTVKLPAIVTSFGSPIVYAWPVRLTSTSLAVPWIVNVCESKSTAEVVVPSVISKSWSVICVST